MHWITVKRMIPNKLRLRISNTLQRIFKNDPGQEQKKHIAFIRGELSGSLPHYWSNYCPNVTHISLWLYFVLILRRKLFKKLPIKIEIKNLSVFFLGFSCSLTELSVKARLAGCFLPDDEWIHTLPHYCFALLCTAVPLTISETATSFEG